METLFQNELKNIFGIYILKFLVTYRIKYTIYGSGSIA